MKLNVRFINKFYVGLLITSLTMISIVVTIYSRITHLKQERMNFWDDFEDDEENFNAYYEYMGDKIAHEIKELDDVSLLKKKVRTINKEQRVHYIDEYVELLETFSVIVVQVHQKVDVEFFKTLLFCLKYAYAISTSMLIFSHDYYDDEMNKIIAEIGFTKYIQIYYPYSTQLFPDSFPGPDYKFCTNDFQCERSVLRYESFAQKKHFWWWQMNYVFDSLNITKAFNNSIIFLESDQFVHRDFIYVAKSMESHMKKRCLECEILSLGAHTPELDQYQVNNINITISSWTPDIASVGIALNRTVWNGIKKYSSFFCNYDDYRWDASLRHLGLNRDKGQFIILSIDAPKIIKYRKCDRYSECSPGRQIEDAANFAKTVHNTFFPQQVTVKKQKIRKKIENVTNIGGWEDVRDRGLCMYLAKG